MKKKLKGETKTLLSATLYKPDLEEIIGIFRSNCTDLQITDDEFEYDSIGELAAKRGQRITKLTIASTAPQLSLMIGKDGNTFLTRGGSVESIVPFTQIKEIIDRNKRSVMAVFFSFSFVLPLLAIEVIFTHTVSKLSIWPLVVAPASFDGASAWSCSWRSTYRSVF